MDFIKSRSFILALIATMLCMIIFYGYGSVRGKSELLDDVWFITAVFFILNTLLFYFVHNRNSLNKILILNEDRLHYALRASGEGIYDWDIKTNKVYYSKSFTEMFGYSPEEFGYDFEAFNNVLHADDRKKVHDSIDRFLKGELEEYSIEFRAYKKDGSIIWINSRADIIKNMKGEPVRIIGTHRDITDVKNKEETLIETIDEAEKQAEIKSSFLAHMSHEIRTPLTAITGIAEILQKQAGDFSEKQQDLIKTLSSSSKNLKELVNDILDFSKIERGEVEVDAQHFPLRELIAEIISIMAVPAREKDISFLASDDAVQNLIFHGDAQRIRQILLNLLSNAIKFTNEGQVKLAIELKMDDQDQINFIVHDTGIGIDAEALPHIFDEFRQEDQSVSKQYGGTGLGLAISKKLAVLMGGDIEVESKKNLGSMFTLTLPIGQSYFEDNDAVSVSSAQKIQDRLSASIRGEQRALIVDDYDGNIVVLTHLLEEIGLKFDVAHNGKEAVKQWKSKQYDLILMDVQMPIMDGLSATQKIRKLEKDNNFDLTPIIGMTAHALVEDKQKCIDAGMTNYLSKPIDNQRLKEIIYHHLHEDLALGSREA